MCGGGPEVTGQISIFTMTKLTAVTMGDTVLLLLTFSFLVISSCEHRSHVVPAGLSHIPRMTLKLPSCVAYLLRDWITGRSSCASLTDGTPGPSTALLVLAWCRTRKGRTFQPSQSGSAD